MFPNIKTPAGKEQQQQGRKVIKDVREWPADNYPNRYNLNEWTKIYEKIQEHDPPKNKKV